ncbi:hypothetical protein [Lactonifactor longoviformis]|uniref:hypothetical protein n=1 Tax=Lactonifactor longoviformis TaxID=341220 RepID=UPI001FA83B6A|nr:hypothetical protein [Lactonifactor longoviformis]
MQSSTVLLDDAQSPFGKALTPVQCLHYCLTRPAVASVMVGMGAVDEVLAADLAATVCTAATVHLVLLRLTWRR